MKPNIGQGDSGKTSLIGSHKKVLKSSSHIEAIGALDELVSLLGLVKVKCRYKKISALLTKIQDHLFRIESCLATANTELRGIPHIGEEHVKFLEQAIEQYEKKLPELQNFILPGGTELAALLHIARAEARRVERVLVRANETAKLHQQAIPYLNRLSDVFFAMARWVNCTASVNETKWIGVGKTGI